MSSSRPTTESTGNSPSATGPTGALFEGQVGAHYLLTMLAEADPRGLPGVSIERVELQRAGEGYPLDDVILRGATQAGEPAVLELQVKRTITFSPSDAVFKDVVAQLAQAFRSLDVTNQRHQFAVATERTSFKITGAYQDVLRWARGVESASVFFQRLNRRRVANDDMRTFVETLRTNLGEASCATDDETVWQLLRRFQILIFDYDAPGSQSLDLAVERSRTLLHATDMPRASALWKGLTEIAIRTASSGGYLDRKKLLEEIEHVDSFRLLGSRRNRAVRETLHEAASLAAADLCRSIAGTTLMRSAQIDAVRGALDHGRYVEICGAPGVGKSGLLGMLIDQVLTEGRAIVLTPERTTPGGWLALKAALKIEEKPEAFLSDLASDGGAVLFIDSLDFFDDPDKRATVTDLLRAAVSVPAFRVMITARTGFDKVEPNWLPAEALAKLGRTRPVVIEELGEEEIEELKATAPSLRALLADSHPARSVARNLFRLSRLLEVEGPTDQLRTEVDLLERWWTTADGPLAARRERARLLADVADVILSGGEHLETRAAPKTVDALVETGTLRELSLDRVIFRHDVLRDWGVAARLHDAADKIDGLPLARAVPSSLARGIELAARFVLERSDNGQTWVEYLKRVSHNGAHASWRRWALLAILRSELSSTLLDRAVASLFENSGALMRELISTTLAVESRPLIETLAEYVPNTEAFPADVFGPINLSWATLVRWLLKQQNNIPPQAIPDVVQLFQNFSVSMFLEDHFTPLMALALANWLEEIEDAQDHHPLAPDPPRFARSFPHRELEDLASKVLSAFLLMAVRAPERAQSYLRRLLRRRNPENTIRKIVKTRGSLAKAAPAELVDITLAGLIPKAEPRCGRTTRDDVFTHLDIDFLPSSPSQGPFLDLLNASPEHGLVLIRQLVDHAVTTRTSGKEPGRDGITVVFPSGARFFPWERSYFWPRQADGCYAVQSGLQALEAWGHTRVEQGNSLDQIIADVLGPEGSPAAFLLVAVDILISHWPSTKTAAIPFLGSPELLAIDRNRHAHDRLPEMDFGDWSAIAPKEPVGTIRLADLAKRQSRHVSLERLLTPFIFDNSANREALRTLLTAAAARLGPPERDDTFADPKFMVLHAINVLDPANWPIVDGKRVYTPPQEEAIHVEALQKKHAPHATDFEIDSAIYIALKDSARSGPELAADAVTYAKRLSAESATPEDVLRSRTNAIVAAALILVRDGTNAQLDEHEAWARDVFAQAFANVNDTTFPHSHKDIRFNAVSIAALGLIHLVRRRRRQEDRDALFDLAVRDEPTAAQGFGAGLAIIREFDPRLVPALLRCALVAQVQPTHAWNDSPEAKGAKQAKHRKLVTMAIAAEIDWLNGIETEPAWPVLPPPAISVRRPLRINVDAAAPPSRRKRSRDQFHSENAAIWLELLTRSYGVGDLAWIIRLVDTYAEWTASANGAGLEQNAEIDSRTDDWNRIYFSLLADAFTRLSPDLAAAHVTRLAGVPDTSFFYIATELVPAIDRAYFSDLGLDLGTALRLRTLLADRLIQTRVWRYERQKAELSIEMRIGPAIGALLFNQYNSFSRATCYLLPKGIDRVDPFLPELVRLNEEGPVPFCGTLTMNLFEVSPRPTHLEFFLSVARTWIQRQPNNKQLWVDNSLGSRVAKWLEQVIGMEVALCSPAHPLKAQIDDLLARLIQLGVAYAHRVEKLLATKDAN